MTRPVVTVDLPANRADEPDATDRWHASILAALDELRSEAWASRTGPVSVQAKLLGRELRGMPIGRGGMCDLLAVLLVETSTRNWSPDPPTKENADG